MSRIFTSNVAPQLTIDHLVAQKLSLRRCAELEHAITGLKISEATFLSYIERINDSLQPWKAGAKKLLLTRPALHVDETGFRVDKKNWWLHAATDGSLTLKYLHRKRGKEAIDAFGTIPFYFGVLIHDRWGSYFLAQFANCALKYQRFAPWASAGSAARSVLGTPMRIGVLRAPCRQPWRHWAFGSGLC